MIFIIKESNGDTLGVEARDWESAVRKVTPRLFQIGAVIHENSNEALAYSVDGKLALTGAMKNDPLKML